MSKIETYLIYTCPKCGRGHPAPDVGEVSCVCMGVDAEGNECRAALPDQYRTVMVVDKGHGVDIIATERQRQIQVKRWTAGHDDLRNDCGELAVAAACYACAATDYTDEFNYIAPREIVCQGGRIDCPSPETSEFPWPDRNNQIHQPTDEQRIRMLAKAGALIAAEIDRLQRRAKP